MLYEKWVAPCAPPIINDMINKGVAINNHRFIKNKLIFLEENTITISGSDKSNTDCIKALAVQ